MPRCSALPVILVLIMSQTVQASDLNTIQFGHDRILLTQEQSDSSEEYQSTMSPPLSVLDAKIKVMPVSIVGFSATQAQTQPHGQNYPSRTRRHTLRNILIITAVVGVLLIALAAADKK
jgi:hypothetical protein